MLSVFAVFFGKYCTNNGICVILYHICSFGGEPVAQIIKLSVGDTVEMKKPHPCAKDSTRFRVMRVGSDIRIVCLCCGRDLTLPRIKLEKSIKHVISEENSEV